MKRAIDRGADGPRQAAANADGSWDSPGVSHVPGGDGVVRAGPAEQRGAPVDSPPVAKGLAYLRDLTVNDIVTGGTYDTALALMAFAAAKDGRRDAAKMLALTRALENGRGPPRAARGGWGYGLGGVATRPDRSNSQYAVLGLRDAAYAGIPVRRKTWEDVKAYWVGPNSQNRDGGYTYTGAGSGARGSMTVAGIATLSILKSVLKRTT